jgi:hypothetical protein
LLTYGAKENDLRDDLTDLEKYLADIRIPGEKEFVRGGISAFAP